MSAMPMSNARREQQKRTRVSAAVTAVTTGDDDARRKAVMNVVQVWLDRLQLISTITTFFAGIDSTILSFAISLTHSASIDEHQWSNTVRVLNASLVGALIFHVCAAITSFVASFVLIRYRLTDMRDHLPPRAPPATSGSSSLDVDKPPTQRFESSPGAIEATHSKDSTAATHINGPPLSHQNSHLAVGEIVELVQSITSTISELEGRVFIHQVQPFKFGCLRRSDKNTSNGIHLGPPIRLLSRCHTLSVTMALLGFILSLLGILTFAWTALPLSISIFSSVCLAGCLSSVYLVLSTC